MDTAESRPYDLILLGVTGFTGKKTAEHITKHLSIDLNGAIAVRNHKTLATVADGLGKLRPDRKMPPIETTTFTKEDLNILVRKTHILISVVGPYHRHCMPVIEACANTGTHYLDSTGETPWVYNVTHRLHELAQTNKVILIPQCAMESAPADLPAFVLAAFIRDKFSASTAEMVHGLQVLKFGLSGGTLHSLITVASSYSFAYLQKSLRPLALCDEGMQSLLRHARLIGSYRAKDVGLLTDSVIGILDTTVVYHSWSLMDYGPRFSYFTGMRAANRVSGFLWHAVMTLSLPLLLLPPLRWLLTKLVPAPGESPPEKDQAGYSATWKSIARSDAGAEQAAVCNMSFAGDMYSLTAILLAEAAMVLLRPARENWAQKLVGGVLTPATLVLQFVERARARGLAIEVEEFKG